MTNEIGYSHDSYGTSFAAFGDVRRLDNSGAQFLFRNTPGSRSFTDATGLYPFIQCEDWYALPDDIATLDDDVVALSFVTDPFAQVDPSWLQSNFDIAKSFKSHFVADFREPIESFVSRKHRRHARKAGSMMTVEILSGNEISIEEWDALYATLARRHQITGIRRFSEQAFVAQFNTPGAIVFRAQRGGEALGIDIWYVYDELAYNHLVAVTDLGYQLHASYALQMTAMNYLKDRVRYASFGGVPGTSDDNSGGLNQFKRGWTNTVRLTFFCGSVRNRSAYLDLCLAAGMEPDAEVFPAYRSGNLL